MTTATQTELRRDSATNVAAATPASGEPAWDTTNKRLSVGDGSTAGGIKVAMAADSQNQTFLTAAVGGTSDAITLTLAPAISAYVAGQRFVFKATADNTTTTPTLNVNGKGAMTMKKITSAGLATMAAGDIKNGCYYAATYDGTYMQVSGIPAAGGTSGPTAKTQLAQSTATGATTMSLTGLTATGYRDLLISVTGASCTVATRALQIELSAGAGFSHSYARWPTVLKYAASNTPTTSTAADQQFIGSAFTQAAADTTTIDLYIYDYANTQQIKKFWMRITCAGQTTDNYFEGVLNTASLIDGSQISWNGSGNFDGSSTMTAYGVN